MQEHDDGTSKNTSSMSLDDCDDKITINTISSGCRERLNRLIERQEERKKSLCSIRSMILRL